MENYPPKCEYTVFHNCSSQKDKEWDWNQKKKSVLLGIPGNDEVTSALNVRFLRKLDASLHFVC